MACRFGNETATSGVFLMASLRYSVAGKDEEDPRIGFSFVLLGYEKNRGGVDVYESPKGRINFEFNFEWFECRLILEAFNQKVEHMKTRTMSDHELQSFIKWLRDVSSKNSGSFQTVHEPFFRIDVKRVSREHVFDASLLLSAYGIASGYYYEDSGLAVIFPAAETQLIRFAEELEDEMKNFQRQYSHQIELWNQYRENQRSKRRSKQI